MSWIEAGTLDALPRLGARIVQLPGDRVALFRTSDDRVFALRDACPHRAGPLSQGIVHGHCVTCPLHDWVIDLATGQATGPDEGATRIYPVRVDAGRVFIEVVEPAANDFESVLAARAR